MGRDDVETSFWVHVPHGAPADISIRLEDGSVRGGSGRWITSLPHSIWMANASARRHSSFRGAASRIPPGASTLRRPRSDRTADHHPSWLGMPSRLGARRLWGLAVQLYTAFGQRIPGAQAISRISRIWRCGRVPGTGRGMCWSILCMPRRRPPDGTFSYLPTSRRFTNPLYLRIEAIPEYSRLAKRGRIGKLRAAVQTRAAHHDSIDRDAVWTAKRAALKQVYRVRRTAGRQLAFDAFKAGKARSWTISRHGAPWPRDSAPTGTTGLRGFRHPSSPDVAGFAREHDRKVDFHRWLRWQLDDQLAAAQSQAIRAGMPLG